MRKTAKDRFCRALKQLALWCRRNRHRPLREQYAVLCQKLRGHYAYYGITGNGRSLQRLRTAAARIWWKW